MKKALLFSVIVVLAALFFIFDLHHFFTLESLKGSLAQFEAWRNESPLLTAGAFFWCLCRSHSPVITWSRHFNLSWWRIIWFSNGSVVSLVRFQYWCTIGLPCISVPVTRYGTKTFWVALIHSQ